MPHFMVQLNGGRRLGRMLFGLCITQGDRDDNHWISKDEKCVNSRVDNITKKQQMHSRKLSRQSLSLTVYLIFSLSAEFGVRCNTYNGFPVTGLVLFVSRYFNIASLS